MFNRSYHMFRLERISRTLTTFSQSVPRFDGAAMSAEPCFLQTIDVRQLS
jgi:hypothetical protein